MPNRWNEFERGQDRDELRRVTEKSQGPVQPDREPTGYVPRGRSVEDIQHVTTGDVSRREDGTVKGVDGGQTIIREQQRQQQEAQNAAQQHFLQARVQELHHQHQAAHDPNFVLYAMQQNEARRMESRGIRQDRVYNPETRTWQQGVAPTRDEESVRRTYQIMQEMKPDVRIMPPTERESAYDRFMFGEPAPRMTGSDIMDGGDMVALTENDRAILSQTGEGRRSLRDFDAKQERLKQDIQQVIPSLVNEDGTLDERTIADVAANHPDFTPAMAGMIRQEAAALSQAVTQSALQMNKLRSETEITEARAGLAKISLADEEVAGTPQAQAARYVQSGGKSGNAMEQGSFAYKHSVVAPSLSAGEQIVYIQQQMDGDPDPYNNRDIDSLAAERWGEVESLDGAITEIELDEDFATRRDATIQEMLEDPNVMQGDMVRLIAAQLADDINAMDLNPAQKQALLNESYAEAYEKVHEQVRNKADEALATHTAGIAHEVTGLFDQVAHAAINRNDPALVKAMKSEGIFNAEWQRQSPEEKRRSLKSFVVNRVQARYDELAKTVTDPDQFLALTEHWRETKARIDAGDAPMENSFDPSEPLNATEGEYARTFAFMERTIDNLMLSGDKETQEMRAKEEELAERASRRTERVKDGKGNDMDVPLYGAGVRYRVGDNLYAVPDRMELAALANRYSPEAIFKNSIEQHRDNPWLGELLQNCFPDGLIDERNIEAMVEISRVMGANRAPPSPSIATTYKDEGVQREVANRVAGLDIRSHERQVLEATHIDLALVGQSGVIDNKEWLQRVQPTLSLATFSGDKQADKDDALEKASAKLSSGLDGIPAVAEMLSGENADPLLARMWNSGDVTSRQRALVAAYVAQRTEVSKRMTMLVTGGEDGEGRTVRGVSDFIDQVRLSPEYMQAAREQSPPDERGQRGAVRTRAQGASIQPFFEELAILNDPTASPNPFAAQEAARGLGQSIDIKGIENRVKEYDKLEKAMSGYGEQFTDPRRFDAQMMNDFAEHRGGSATGVLSDIEAARELLNLYGQIMKRMPQPELRSDAVSWEEAATGGLPVLGPDGVVDARIEVPEGVKGAARAVGRGVVAGAKAVAGVPDALLDADRRMRERAGSLPPRT